MYAAAWIDTDVVEREGRREGGNYYALYKGMFLILPQYLAVDVASCIGVLF